MLGQVVHRFVRNPNVASSTALRVGNRSLPNFFPYKFSIKQSQSLQKHLNNPWRPSQATQAVPCRNYQLLNSSGLPHEAAHRDREARCRVPADQQEMDRIGTLPEKRGVPGGNEQLQRALPLRLRNQLPQQPQRPDVQAATVFLALGCPHHQR